jgi:hypothetical protein
MTQGRKRIPCPNGVLVPEPPEGWFAVRYAVTLDGQLACFQATYDVNAAWRERRDASIPEGARGALFVFDGQTAGERAEFDLEFPFPKFDRLPDGRWLFAGSRCSVNETNAKLFEADGMLIQRFCLGDGIEHLQCAPDATLWVGYFDEGVYGNHGWGWQGGPEPIGHPGLVRFATDGHIVWSYDVSAPGVPVISDCYALNVGNDVWACTYSNFPILRFDEDGQRTWTNTVGGAKAIAIEGDNIVLFGGYRALDAFKTDVAEFSGSGEARDRLALLRLGEAEANLVEEFDLNFGGVGDAAAALVGGRGNQLHFVADDMWFRLSVAEIVDAIEFIRG